MGAGEGPADTTPAPPHAGVKGGAGAGAGCSSLAGCNTSAEDAMTSLVCVVHPTPRVSVCGCDAGGCLVNG